MGIKSKEKKGNITIFIAEKEYNDEKMESQMNKLLKDHPNSIGSSFIKEKYETK